MEHIKVVAGAAAGEDLPVVALDLVKTLGAQIAIQVEPAGPELAAEPGRRAALEIAGRGAVPVVQATEEKRHLDPQRKGLLRK